MSLQGRICMHFLEIICTDIVFKFCRHTLRVTGFALFFLRSKKHLLLLTHSKNTSTHQPQICPSRTLHTHQQLMTTPTTIMLISNLTYTSKNTQTHRHQLRPLRPVPDGPSADGGGRLRPPLAPSRTITRDVPPSHAARRAKRRPAVSWLF